MSRQPAGWEDIHNSCTSERDEYLEYVKHGGNSTKYPKVKQPGKWANEMKTYFLKEDVPVIKKHT